MQASSSAPDYHYVAYIDESGDDGLRRVKPLDTNGSSEWLILSAVVVRAEQQSEIPAWVDDFLKGRRSRQARSVHFSKLSHRDKIEACQHFASKPARFFVVASNKKNMRGYRNPRAENIPSQCWFYCWMTRVLLERVSHFVSEHSLEEYGEEKRVRLEFSARGGLNYGQMGAYFQWLQMKRHKPFLPWGNVNFNVMHTNLLYIYPHYEREGLQIADVVASAFFKACDKHDTGGCDGQYAQLLRPRMARQPDNIGGAIAGYGVKLMPSWRKADLDSDQAGIFRDYGYPGQWWDPKAFSD